MRAVDLTSGNVSTIAGSGRTGLLDGPSLEAEFHSPQVLLACVPACGRG